MKIGLLSPPWIALPPPGYGGIEHVVYTLAEGLQKRGHNVSIFATGDSHVSGELHYFYKQALGLDILLRRTYPLFLLNHISSFLKQLPPDIDIIHNHCEYVGIHLLDHITTPFVHTLHGPYYKGFDDETKIYDNMSITIRDTLRMFNQHPYISISHNQRIGMPDLKYIATVYNGVSIDNYPFVESPDEYMYWIGRFSPQKGLLTAIQTALATKRKLQFSTVVHGAYKKQFDTHIVPLLKNNITFLGPENDAIHKSYMFGHAKVFLFPLRGEEPFGLVMAESMATGTPVIAYARGSAPEVIEDGVTGFLVNPSGEKRGSWIIKKQGREGIQEAIEKIYSMPDPLYKKMRQACRQRVEHYFTTDRMVDNYLLAYEKVLSKR